MQNCGGVRMQAPPVKGGVTDSRNVTYRLLFFPAQKPSNPPGRGVLVFSPIRGHTVMRDSHRLPAWLFIPYSGVLRRLLAYVPFSQNSIESYTIYWTMLSKVLSGELYLTAFKWGRVELSKRLFQVAWLLLRLASQALYV